MSTVCESVSERVCVFVVYVPIKWILGMCVHEHLCMSVCV